MVLEGGGVGERKGGLLSSLIFLRRHYFLEGLFLIEISFYFQIFNNFF